MTTGIGIIAWNRPKNLRRLLESVVKNDLRDLEFHLFQDGNVCRFRGVETTFQIAIQKSIATFQEFKLPRNTLHIRQENVSIAIHQYQALQFLSSNYDKFILIEEDTEISPYCLVLLTNALEWAKKKPEIASISPGFKKLGEDPKKIKLCNGHAWIEAFWSDRARKVLKEYQPYYDMVKYDYYKNRKDAEIFKFFKDNGFNGLASSQDNGRDYAVFKAGMTRARFVLNRATGTGLEGFHSVPEKAIKHGEFNTEIYISEEDKNLKEFIINDSSCS